MSMSIWNFIALFGMSFGSFGYFVLSYDEQFGFFFGLMSIVIYVAYKFENSSNMSSLFFLILFHKSLTIEDN
jgi:nicotinamide riboside transporter PnuC